MGTSMSTGMGASIIPWYELPTVLQKLHVSISMLMLEGFKECVWCGDEYEIVLIFVCVRDGWGSGVDDSVALGVK